MTDPSTLFLNALQVRPSWSQNGLTFQLNVAPTQISNSSQPEIGDSVFAITQSSAAILSASVLNNAITTACTSSSNSTTITNALMQSDSIAESNTDISTKSPESCSVSADSVNLKTANILKNDSTTVVQATMSTSDQQSNTQTVRLSSVKKVAIGTPRQATEISTGTMSNFQDNTTIIQNSHSANVTPLTINSSGANATCPLTAPSQALTTKSATTIPITINGSTASNNAGIPVGIAVARQRYVSSTSCKSQTQNLKETMTTSTTTLPYMSTIPYQQPIIEPSLFPPSIANIGIVAGTTGCDDRTLTNLSGNIFPSIIAWPPQQQHQQQQQLQPWYQCPNPIETATQNMPPACAGYQLVRDPVSGNYILIPANHIGSTQQPTAAAGFTATNQQIQSFIIPQHFHHQQQSQTHSVFLDHLVSIVPSSTNTKQANAVSSTVLKLNDGVLTGVMMPCDMTKSSAAVGQQVISANNSSISLVHQFNSSNIHNSNINSPHHFQSISSSGSLLIQQISGNSGQPPVINHINNSVMIAESTAMQSVINTQPSYLFNNQVSSDSSSINQVPVHPQSTCIVTTTNAQQNEPVPALSQLPASSENTSCPPKPSIIQLKVNTEKQVHVETKPVNEQICLQQFVADKNEEKTVIKVDLNSSVQDASNQTEYTLDDDDDNNDDDEIEDGVINDDDPESASSDAEEGGNQVRTKNKGSSSKCRRIIDEIKVYSDENPDFSGLQLLLNGIERAESNGDKVKSDMKVTKKDSVIASDKEEDKPTPNGLEILCALADQRFKEEKNSESDNVSSSYDDDDVDDCKRKFKYKKGERDARHSKNSRDLDAYSLSLKNPVDDRLSSLNACENQLEMRLELVKLQKKYRETRKELNRFKHRKHESSLSSTRSPTPTKQSHSNDSLVMCGIVKRKPGRPRKYHDGQNTKFKADICSSSCGSHKLIKPMKRPNLKFDADSCVDGSDDDFKVSNMDDKGDLSPPVLEPMCESPKPQSFKTDILSPPTLIPSKKLFVGPKGFADNELKQSSEFEYKSLLRCISDDSSDDDSKVNSFARSRESSLTPIVQKRKVGRPKKSTKESLSGSNDPTLSRKSLPVVSAVTCKFDRKNKSFVHKSSEKQIPVTSSVVSSLALLKVQRKSSDSNHQITEVEHKPKITPKLKAEAKLKTWRQESPEPCKNALEDLDYFPNRRKSESRDSPIRSISDKSIFAKSDTSNAKEKEIEKDRNEAPVSHSKSKKSDRIPRTDYFEFREEDLRITPELLDSNEKVPIRVLICVGGLFRAGELTAITPPDIYGIKLDGERGQKTHIHTKEEVLKNVIREVKGQYPLRNGTRVCAFWSAQYLSLYPGYVTSFSSSEDSDDDNFTAVEFDDGDSGRITTNKIRILPKDFPIHSRAGDDCVSCESTTEGKRRTSSISFDEIPVDKQLHSPDRSSFHRTPVKNNPESSPPASGTTESISSRISSDDLQQSEKIDVTEISKDVEKNENKKNGERKKLKKKHKTKIRDNSESSCKHKGLKRKSDTDDGSIKSHKRRKHKHKHHKHHKRKRSQSRYKYDSESGRVYEKKSKYLDDENDWTYVPPYSDHLIDKKSKKSKKFNESSTSKTESEKTFVPQLEIRADNDVSIEESKNGDNIDTKIISENRDEENNCDLKEELQDAKDITKNGIETETPNKEGKEEEIKEEKEGVVEDDEDDDDDESSGDEQFWHWCGKGIKRNGKGRGKKEFYKSIQRGNEIISIGDCAVFLTAGSSAKPFIGRIESLWEDYGGMMVRVNWFYHPEETTGLEKELPFLGALFESPHTDKNDVQTISHKCCVVPIKEYKKRLETEPERIHNVYESNDLYYLAGYYDPTAKKLSFEDDVVS